VGQRVNRDTQDRDYKNVKQVTLGKSEVGAEADNVSDADELPKLTPKQLAFVLALLRGKTASDAYREAYDCEGMASNSIWVAASRLRSDAKVALWLRTIN
jgi:hypothetical protein